MKKLSILVFLIIPNLLVAQLAEHLIHVDQFGYTPNAQKIAVIADPELGFNSNLNYGTPGTIQVKRSDNNEVVITLSADQWNAGNTHSDSGDKGWWVDFSSLSEPGRYYIFDTNTAQRSPSFNISNSVYNEALRQASRMFYYNRCGFEKTEEFAAEWSDVNCFIQDESCLDLLNPSIPELNKDLSGGWFDAGDYNKYVTFAFSPVNDLLSAFEENPHVFGDNNGIPESNNGVPDILDELKWELDWLMKMNNEDGSTHIKMGSISYDDNSLYPPSANLDDRYYGPVCTSASIAIAGMFAHAALVFEQFPEFSSYAEDLRVRAENSWDWMLEYYMTNSLMENCDDGSITAGDADWTVYDQQNNAVASAVFLYELTGDENYNEFVQSFYNSTEPLFQNFWGAYRMTLNEALLRYANIPGADDQVYSLIQTSFITDVTNDWNGYYGLNENDLYRAFMPSWSYHWGSNMPRCNYGVLNKMIAKYGFAGGNAESQNNMAAAQLHWLHGTNPLGLCYLSNMYDFGVFKSVNQIYHTWFADGSPFDDALSSAIGPPPGYLSGGPNASFSVAELSPPSGQPLQKSYLDFNDGWPNNSWEITEPAIYYQAAYIRLLAWMIPEDQNVGISTRESSASLRIFPNPNHGEFRIHGEIPQSGIDIFSSMGAWIRHINYSELQNGIVNLSNLSSGMYIAKTVNESITFILD